MALRQRLVQDIAELQKDPYPNICVVPDDTDIYSACLLLTVNDGTTLHLNIKFPTQYPLSPPKISIQSSISHPNVFGGYICASLLNTTEDYTPAYNLKGICIQMLSFFTSDSIEDVAGFTSNLRLYREDPLSYRVPFNSDTSTKDLFNVRDVMNIGVYTIIIQKVHAQMLSFLH